MRLLKCLDFFELPEMMLSVCTALVKSAIVISYELIWLESDNVFIAPKLPTSTILFAILDNSERVASFVDSIALVRIYQRYKVYAFRLDD